MSHGERSTPPSCVLMIDYCLSVADAFLARVPSLALR